MDFRKIDKIVLIAVVLIGSIWVLAKCSGRGPEDAPAGEAASPDAAAKAYKPGQVFIVWDSVRLRSGPSRDSSALMTLYRDAPVTYTGRFSDFSEEISQEGVKYREPWVEVRAVNNKTGWIFGGSVRIYPQR